MHEQSLRSLFWEINDRARADSGGSARKHHDRLVELLLEHDAETIRALSEEERAFRARYRSNPEYGAFHVRAGGFVLYDGNTLHRDFGGWLVAQGEDLLEAFEGEGREAVERYIKERDVGPWDYLFESMSYAYDDALELKESPESVPPWREAENDVPDVYAWAVEKYAGKTYGELAELYERASTRPQRVFKAYLAIVFALTVCAALALLASLYALEADVSFEIGFALCCAVLAATAWMGRAMRFDERDNEELLGISHVMRRRCPF